MSYWLFSSSLKIHYSRMILRPFSNSLWCFLRADGSFWRWTLRRSSWRCVAPRRRSWRRCRVCTRAWSLTHGMGWRILSRSSRTRFLRSRRRQSGWSRTCCDLITEASFCAPKLCLFCTCACGTGLWTGSDSVKGHSLVRCVSLCCQKKKENARWRNGSMCCTWGSHSKQWKCSHPWDSYLLFSWSEAVVNKTLSFPAFTCNAQYSAANCILLQFYSGRFVYKFNQMQLLLQYRVCSFNL